MSGEVATVMDAIRDSVLNATPDTAWDGASTFRQQKDTSTASETKRGLTRSFSVEATGEHTLTGPMFQLTEPFAVEVGFEVTIAYKAGRDRYALNRIILQDVDRIKYSCMRATYWTAAMQRVTSDGFEVDAIADTADTIGAYFVRIPFTVQYEPSF